MPKLSTKIARHFDRANDHDQDADDLDREQDLVEPAGALVRGGGLWYFAVFAYHSITLDPFLTRSLYIRTL
jgi:hypothetical protein